MGFIEAGSWSAVAPAVWGGQNLAKLAVCAWGSLLYGQSGWWSALLLIFIN